jgi:hypothetical protein
MIARYPSVVSLVVALAAGPAAAQTATPAETATPRPTATRPTATPTAAVVATPTRAAASPVWSISPSPVPARATAIPVGDAGAVAPAPDGGTSGMPAAPAAPRAFRTPERAGDPAFVAPRGAAPESAAPNDAGIGMPAPAPMRPPARGGTRTVVFHAVARTAVYGVALVVLYPRTVGDFVGSGEAVDCTAGGGTPLTKNDRDDGTMRLLLASASPLSLPFDISCRFAVAAGASIGPGDFGVQVAELTTVDGAGKVVSGDPGLLSVSVAVR